MQFTHTTLTATLALASSALALPADNHKDELIISVSYDPHHGVSTTSASATTASDVTPFETPFSANLYVGPIAIQASGTLEIGDLPTLQTTMPTPMPTPEPFVDDAATLEKRGEKNLFKKLRSGKCTGYGGQCKIRINGFRFNKQCENGTGCSSNGSPCFMEGHSLTKYHISCT